MSYEASQWVKIQELHRTPKKVLDSLASRAKYTSLDCFPSQQTIATDVGLSRRTVGSAIRYLEEQKFIERVPRHRSNGSRKSDLCILLMETKQTVVQTWRSYSVYLEETDPARYAHRDSESDSGQMSQRSNGNGSGSQWERERGPMGTGEGANGNAVPTLNKKIQVEVEAEVQAEERTREGPGCTTDTSVVQKALIRIVTAEKQDGEWDIAIAGLDAYRDNKRFWDWLAALLEAGLEADLSTSTLTRLLQDAWKDEHWAVTIDELDRQLSHVLGRPNILASPGRT